MHLIEDTSQLDITKIKKAYDGLISQRNQHTDVQFNTIELLGSSEVCRDVHISYPAQLILRKFRGYAEKQGFVVLESFCDEMYLIHSKRCSKFKLALCCLLSSYRTASSRFYVYTDEYRSVRVLVLQNLNYGQAHTLLLKTVLNKFCQKYFPNPPLMEDLDNQQDIKSLESTSLYMYSKMLLEQNYSMGQKIKSFLDAIPKGDISLGTIEWIENMKNEVVEDMLEGFNCSRKELTQILCYCRIVVEEFLYMRVFPLSLEPTPKILQQKPLFKDFAQTINQIVKLDTIVSPSLFDKQIFYVLTAGRSEFEIYSGGQPNRVVAGGYPQTLSQLMRELQLPNLRSRMRIQELYHEINGQPEHFLQFQKAFRSLSPQK